jgi:CDP-glucose 4,6-dehydratase
MLDISKAIHRLGWQPALSFPETVGMTADWYARFAETDVWELCVGQIEAYQERFRI